MFFCLRRLELREVISVRNILLTTATALALLLNCVPVWAMMPDRQAPDKIIQEKLPDKPTVIQLGSRGDDVRLVQKLLTDSGFYAGELDGVFGSGTQQALQDFQTINNLPANGIVTKDTLNYLRRSISEPSRFSRSLNMVATAYTRYDDGCGDYTYCGHYLHKGLVAVDPNVIPLGTRLFIPGYGYAIADDTGGAIKGTKIDLAFESLADAYQFGVQRVTVYILN
jgi:3D (Asp-Asp-Asp) domain-containing protein